MVDGDVSGVAVRPEPLMTEEFGGSDVLGVGTRQHQGVEQQQQQSEPVTVGAVAISNGPGAVRTVATSSGPWSVRRSVLPHQEGFASTHPFDPGTPKHSMPPLRPKNEPGTVGGGMTRETRRTMGVEAAATAAAKVWMRWDGTSLFPFDRGKTPRALPWHVLSSVASLDS